MFQEKTREPLTKPELAKLYREFSRQKYNKYRHQFPRMRESELVSKIIKEWESFGVQEKEDLYRTYITEKHLSDERSESSDNNGKGPSPGSSKSKKKKAQAQSLKKGLVASSGTPAKKGGLRVFVESSSSKKLKAQS